MTRPDATRRRPGFTMVELLVVITIITLLIGLLLPAVNSAVRAARNAAVQTEINSLGSALTQFKSDYGDYPPSRLMVDETGYMPLILATPVLTGASAEVTYGQLYQRGYTAFRKFWPKMLLSTFGSTGVVPPYDFNGNGNPDGAYMIQGTEALVFFLGGMPNQSGGGMQGWAKDPTNPFKATQNRKDPLFEFKNERLFIAPGSKSNIPSYRDSLAGSQQNFYAFFSTNNGSGYDPNDVNLVTTVAESDGKGASPIGLRFKVGFPVYSGSTLQNNTLSPSPNPYTSGPTYMSGPLYTSPPTATITVAYINAQTFQIISPGSDGVYGVGGAYVTAGTVALPREDSAGSVLSPYVNSPSTDQGLRSIERDNLTNFHNGKLD